MHVHAHAHMHVRTRWRRYEASCKTRAHIRHMCMYMHTCICMHGRGGCGARAVRGGELCECKHGYDTDTHSPSHTHPGEHARVPREGAAERVTGACRRSRTRAGTLQLYDGPAHATRHTTSPGHGLPTPKPVSRVCSDLYGMSVFDYLF